MSNEVRRLMTEEQRQRLFLARRRGGLCAACGRVLSDKEAVYIEQFRDDRGILVTAPVGVECASPAFLDDTQGQEPERCAGCGRGVYYRVANTRRARALCSRYCAARIAAKRTSVEG